MSFGGSAVTSCAQHGAAPQPLHRDDAPVWGERLLTTEGCACDASSLAARGAAMGLQEEGLFLW